LRNDRGRVQKMGRQNEGGSMKWRTKEDNWRVPILSWCEDVDEGALKQAQNLATHPVVFHHVALMPDCHLGYGMPIGGVIACENAIVPNAVGVDIACGMIAVKTNIQVGGIDSRDIGAILNDLKRRIPVGFHHHREDQDWNGFDDAPDIPIIQQELASARKQLGTLGSGNHFLEVQSGDDNRIWLMLHSGSRNIGYKIAKTYNKMAMKLCGMWHSQLPPGNGEDSLAFLPIGSREAKEYIDAMKFAMRFAEASRQSMMENFLKAFKYQTDGLPEQTININHNFANLEHHFGRNVWVHRKGATQARKGQLGIIPGSMGTSSYIVRGLGNPDSFESCSHGAGRASGRAEFCRTHTVEECDESMEGIVFAGWGKNRKGKPDVSEAPKAYKDIDEVIEAENDLVEVVVKLRPLGVMKG